MLPAPAYVRGFLRTYGDMLDLDGEMLADRYQPTSGVWALELARLHQRPDLLGCRVERRAPGQHIEQDVRVEEDVPAHAPWRSSSAS